ncbi:MAG: TatD family hydrolase [Parcubacteria group bacterium]|nr:TatD family hydrolase [Parcubacteria group bacterium]
MTLFDSHCHLHLPQYDDDREEMIGRLKEAGIKAISVGTDLEESKKAIELTKKYPDLLWASIGLHPNDNLEENFDIGKYRELAKDQSVVAIGECGLDYAFFARERNERFQKRASAEAFGKGGLSQTRTKSQQKDIFIKQIELAKELNKPIILHCRPSAGSQDAYEDAIDILNSYFTIPDSSGNGVAHFFVGSKETAEKFIDLGFYISFAGPITFADEYKEAVEYVPLDKILIETDSPFAAPAPHRGKRNEPAYVEFVARKIAEWKGLSFDKVATQTHNNAKALFKI